MPLDAWISLVFFLSGAGIVFAANILGVWLNKSGVQSD